MLVPEDLLHFIWKFRLFKRQQLITTGAEQLEIVRPGFHNHNAGPDFENAKIKIGDTLWVGNVEIHVNSSDWYRHQHQNDMAYDNVILHVVARHDQEILRSDGTNIAVLEVEDLISEEIKQNYFSLMTGINWIPCEKKIKEVEHFYIKKCLNRILIERLEERTEQLQELLNEFKESWDNAFYITIARNFGFKTNALPFEMLARSLPQNLLAKYKNRPLHIESLIFGQAGFLNANFKDEYPKLLKQEYQFLKKKHSLKPVDKYLWKYMRLRPSNFPTLRLAQFAALIVKSNHLFSKILNEKDISAISKMFFKIQPALYWQSHYRFEQVSQHHSASMGRDAIDNILINTIAVFLFAYGHKTGMEEYYERGIKTLENLKPEMNVLIKRFNEIGVESDNAACTQALIQLKKSYCDQKKCLSCEVGYNFLNK